MSWTYDINLDDNVSKVRLRIGDTRIEDQQMQDEEIQGLLTLAGDNVLQAAVYAVRALIGKYARYADKWVGDLKILASQRMKGYALLLETLQAETSDTLGLGYAGVPIAGGVYVVDKIAMAQRTDIVHPSFSRGLHDNDTIDGATSRLGDDWSGGE